MKKAYLTASSAETRRLGRMMAGEFLNKRPKNKALVVGLEGDLGSGKTTFLQGFARGVGVKGKILSPTFIIIRRISRFFHIDCYRLKNSEELLFLGFKNIVSDPKNVVVVEWVNKVKKVLPKEAFLIKFAFVGPNKRKIVLM